MLRLAAAISLLALGSAHAEEPLATLEPVTILGKKDSTVSPTFTMAKETIRQTPGGVAIVPAEDYKQRRAVTIKDMLDYTPGVLAQSRVNEESRLSIRGSGLSRTYHLRGLNLYQDNIPINLTDGSADFQDIDPLAFRYVEVYKGANALPLGSATLGGAINFVTPTGYDADRFGARVEGGSFNTSRVQASSGQVFGKTDYFASFSSLQSEGFRNFSDQENNRFYSNLGTKLSDSLETRFYFTYADLNQELPGNLTKTQLKANPKQANGFNRSNNHQRDMNVYRIANKTSWRGDNMEANGGIYTLQKDLYHPIFQLIDQQNSDYGIFGDTTFFGSLAGKRNELKLGTNLSTGYTESLRYVNNFGQRGAKTVDGKEQDKNAVFYAENRFYPISQLALITGSQFIYTNRDYTDRFLSNGDQSGEKDYYGISPKIGALWEVSPNLQLFSNLSGSYEPPTYSELEQSLPGTIGLANIEAQRAVTFEVGTRGNWQRYDWDLSLYRSWLRDELMMYTVAPGQNGIINANKSAHQGIELGFGAKLLDGLFLQNQSVRDSLKFRAAYTYSDFHFVDDASYHDNKIPGAPEHYIRGELRYDHPKGFYLAPNVEAVPKGYAVDMTNTLYSDSYALLGVNAGYDITKNVTVFLDARNLTDKKYAATTDVITAPTASNTAVFAPGDGRSLYVGLSLKW